MKRLFLLCCLSLVAAGCPQGKPKTKSTAKAAPSPSATAPGPSAAKEPAKQGPPAKPVKPTPPACKLCGGFDRLPCPVCKGTPTESNGLACVLCEAKGEVTCQECKGPAPSPRRTPELLEGLLLSLARPGSGQEAAFKDVASDDAVRETWSGGRSAETWAVAQRKARPAPAGEREEVLQEGVPRAKGTLVNGKRHGRWTFFHMQFERDAQNKPVKGPDGKFVRVEKSRHYNGYRHGVLHGPLQEGTKVVSFEYCDGVLARARYFSKDGSVYALGSRDYVGGIELPSARVKGMTREEILQRIPWQWLSLSLSELKSEGPVDKRGLPTGPGVTSGVPVPIPANRLRPPNCTIYYAGGEVAATGCYLNGKRTHLWTFRYPSGEKLAKGSYADLSGKLHGRWTWWDRGGGVAFEGVFTKGVVDRSAIAQLNRKD
jgi:hypothetical protein